MKSRLPKISPRLMNQFRSNKHYQKTNHYQNKNNTSFDIQFNNFFIFHKNNYTTALNQYATTNANIPSDKFNILGSNLNFGFFTIKGTIITAPNQPADKLINKSENVIQSFGSTFTSISQTIRVNSRKKIEVDAFKESTSRDYGCIIL